MTNEELPAKVKELTETKNQHPCPSCGHCPTCGRSAAPQRVPYNPWAGGAYPYWRVDYPPQVWYGTVGYAQSASFGGTSGTLTVSGNA